MNNSLENYKKPIQNDPKPQTDIPSYTVSKENKESLYNQIREDAQLRHKQRFEEERRMLRQQVMQNRDNMVSGRQELENIRLDAMRGLERSASSRGLHGSGMDALSRVQTAAQLGSGVSELERQSAATLSGVQQGLRSAQESYSSGMRQADIDYASQMNQSDEQFLAERRQTGLDIMDLYVTLRDNNQLSQFEDLLIARGLDLRALDPSQRALLAKEIGNPNYNDPNYQPLVGEDGGVDTGNGYTTTAQKDAIASATGQKYVIDGKAVANSERYDQVKVMTDSLKNYGDFYNTLVNYTIDGTLDDLTPIQIFGMVEGEVKKGNQDAIDYINASKVLNYNPLDGADRPFKVKGMVAGEALSFDNPYQLITFLEKNLATGAYRDRVGIKLEKAPAGNFKIMYYDKLATGKQKTYKTYKKLLNDISPN